MALAKLVFDGVFDRFPTLRMGFLEAGCGWLPDLMHAFHEHWEKRIRDFDPRLEPQPGEFVAELLRERRAGSLQLSRKARNLLGMLFTPRRARGSRRGARALPVRASPLAHDPREYFQRGQVFVSFESDDPAPAYLPAALGEIGGASAGSPPTTATGTPRCATASGSRARPRSTPTTRTPCSRATPCTSTASGWRAACSA